MYIKVYRTFHYSNCCNYQLKKYRNQNGNKETIINIEFHQVVVTLNYRNQNTKIIKLKYKIHENHTIIKYLLTDNMLHIWNNGYRPPETPTKLF